MSYMLLIHEPVGQRATRSEAEGRAAYDAMLRFGADLKARGLLVASESLASEHAATRGPQIKRQIRDAFYTDTLAWKQRVVAQAVEAARQAVAGLASVRN